MSHANAPTALKGDGRVERERPSVLGRGAGAQQRADAIRSRALPCLARARYRDAGHATNDRPALRTAMAADGWTDDPQVWIDAGRP